MNDSPVSRDLGDGELLWSAPAAPDALFLVEQGCLQLLRAEAGQEVLLAELGPGEAIAPPAPGDDPAPVRVRASGPARVLALDPPTLEARLRQEPTLARTLVLGLSQASARLVTELARRAGEPAAEVRYVYVVPKDQPELFEQLQQEFGSDPQVKIVIDRREGERRQSEANPPERRGPGRRDDPAWSIYLSQPFKPGHGRFVPIQRKKE